MKIFLPLFDDNFIWGKDQGGEALREEAKDHGVGWRKEKDIKHRE